MRLSGDAQVCVGGTVLLQLGESVGQGGEANVFGVVDEPHLAVKLLRSPGRSEHRLDDHLSIRAMKWIDDRGMPRLAWPIERAETLVTDANGHRMEGHVMLRLRSEEWLPLSSLISGRDRARFAEHFLAWDQLLVVARDVAQLVADLHAHEPQIIAADLKTKNAMVSRAGNDVALIDCDSMIVRDPDPDRHTIVSVGNPPVSEETVPPELLADSLAARTVHTDAWAVAVIVCMLLMDGQHPFSGTHGRSARKGNHSVTDNVVNGRTIFKPRGGSLKLTHPVYPRVLPTGLQDLAHKCFVVGHSRPSARPTPADWVKAIDAVGPVNMCERFPRFSDVRPTQRHRYASHLRVCPWCELMTTGAPDAFPEVHRDGGRR